MPAKKLKRSPPAIHVNAQPIPGSFLGRVVKRCNGDWYMAALLFYRARRASSVIRYIQGGMSAGWIFNPTADESRNPDQVRTWVEENVFKVAAESQAVEAIDTANSLGDIMKAMGL